MRSEEVTIGVYFKVKDSEMYGGDGTIGYASILTDTYVDSIKAGALRDYVRGEVECVADMCKVPVENVLVVSRDEYEEGVKL